MAKLVGDVAPFDIAEVTHPAHEFLAEWIVARGSRPDVPDTRRLARLLRVRRERQRGRRAAEKSDELAPICSIELHEIPNDEWGTATQDIELAAISQRVLGGPPRTPASRLVPPPHAAHARPNVSICIAIP